MLTAARSVLVLFVLAAAAACGQPQSSPSPAGSPAPGQSSAPSATGGRTAAPTGGAESLEPTGGPASLEPTGGPASLEPTGAASTSQPSGDVPTDIPRPIIAFEPFVDGLEELSFVTHAGDGSGRLYAVEQHGVIWTVEPDGSVHPDPFVDLTDRISNGGERGLLGLAFHPDHASNGRLFVDYTDTNGDTVVAELARSGEATADPASERVLLQVAQPFGNHNGGMIAFGPDGHLYIALGDGGGAGDPQGNGQDTSTLLGKILRIDVDAGGDAPYGIPADNPFADGAGGRPEIWAWGMRNPWRFSFDRQTGALFIGDVGQNMTEEVDVQPAGRGGLNFGWNTMEGPNCYGGRDCDQSGLTLPVFSYDRRGGGECAVTGGYVYRGSALAGLAGTYLFADYCSGRVWGMDVARAESEFNLPFEQLDDLSFRVSSFGEDEAGELYVVDHGGAILRLVGRDAR